MASAAAKGVKMVPSVVGVTLNLTTDEAMFLRKVLKDYGASDAASSIVAALHGVFKAVEEGK